VFRMEMTPARGGLLAYLTWVDRPKAKGFHLQRRWRSSSLPA